MTLSQKTSWAYSTMILSPHGAHFWTVYSSTNQ